MTTLASLELKLNSLTSKMNVLVKNGKPANINEFISIHTIAILIIIAIVTGIWVIIIIKKFELEDKNYWITVAISVVGLIAIYLLARQINKD